MTKQRTNKRPKSYYVKSANKRFKNDGYELDAGMKGFLVTCNRNEYECRKDAYQLLNEYADEMYGPKEGYMKEESDEEEDFDLAMKKEVTSLKEKKEWRFKALKTGANSVLFIKAEIENPCELAHYILTDLQQTKKLKSRAILRLLPISGTCKTYEDKVEKLAEEIVAPHFEFSCKTYMYVIKIRSNNAVKCKTIMGILDKIVQRNEDLNHHANMNDPELVVLVEVIRNICCMSVVKDFKKFRRYNLHSIVEDPKVAEENKTDGKTENDVDDVKEDGSGIDSTPAVMETSAEPVENVKESEEKTEIGQNVDDKSTDDVKEPEESKTEVHKEVDDELVGKEAEGDPKTDVELEVKEPEGIKVQNADGSEPTRTEADI